MEKEYERKGEWSGYKIHKAKTGFVIEYWSRVQGTLTDDSYLLPYGDPSGGFDRDTDLNDAFNDHMTIGELLAEYTIRENDAVRLLRKGHSVQ